MTLPISRNTTYAALSQVKSADLNDFQDQIMHLHMQHQIHWSPIGQSITGGATSSNVAPLFEADTSTNIEIYTREAGAIANTPFPSVNPRVKVAAGPTEYCAIYPKDDGAGNNAWFDDLDDLTIAVRALVAVSDIDGGYDIALGLCASGTFGSSMPGAGAQFVRKASDSPNDWYIGSDDSSRVDTGVAGADSTWEHLALIYYGKNTARGIAAGNIPVVDFFIDGALEGSITTNIPSGASQLTPFIYVRDDVAAGDIDVYIGPMHISWSSLLLDF